MRWSMANKPTHIVYHVKKVAGDDRQRRGVRTRVGAGWPHQNARGLSLVLDLLPPDGRLVVRTVVPGGYSPPDEERTAGELPVNSSAT
jgi:hypothetical protein